LDENGIAYGSLRLAVKSAVDRGCVKTPRKVVD